MRKILSCVLAFILVLGLTACSGVSQEEYDKVVEESQIKTQANDASKPSENKPSKIKIASSDKSSQIQESSDASEPLEYQKARDIIQNALESIGYNGDFIYIDSDVETIANITHLEVKINFNSKDYYAVCMKLDDKWHFITLQDNNGKNYYADTSTKQYIDLYDINTGELVSKKQKELPTSSELLQSQKDAYKKIQDDLQSSLDEIASKYGW